MTRLLLVDGYAAYLDAFAAAVERAPGFRVALRAGSLAEAAAGIAQARKPIDIALVGRDLPDGDAGALRPHLQAHFPACHLVLYGIVPERRALARAIALGAAGAFPIETPLARIVDDLERLVLGESMIPPGERAALVQEAARDEEAARAVRVALGRLTPREWEILAALTRGLGDKAIALQLGISSKTVAVHIAHLLKKLEVESRLQAALLAVRTRVIDLDGHDAGG
jgi:two-component system nitrate/nitrite response regulator NarL